MKYKIYCKHCGQLVPKNKNQNWVIYRQRKYCSNACSLKYHSIAKQGAGHKWEKHPRWNGGAIIMDGYRYLRMPGHHLATVGNRNYAAEHRVVAEQKIGRRLLPGEVVHHIDHNPLNNHPDNLEVCLSSGEHTKTHHENAWLSKKSSYIRYKKCVQCGATFVVNWRNARKITCTPACKHRYQGNQLIGKPSTSSTKFKKGLVPWNKKK